MVEGESEKTETNEQAKTEEGKQDTNPKNALLSDSLAVAERMEKAAEAAKKEADRLEELYSNKLLGGTAGVRPEVEPAKEETDKEYAEKVMKGELK